MINITFPIPEKVSANDIYAGMHWSKRKKIADLYHRYMSQFKVTIAEYPVEISYLFTFKGRALDTTNTFFMVKMLEDGMVRNKMLQGDSIDFVQSTTIYSRKGKKDEVNIIIT